MQGFARVGSDLQAVTVEIVAGCDVDDQGQTLGIGLQYAWSESLVDRKKIGLIATALQQAAAAAAIGELGVGSAGA